MRVVVADATPLHYLILVDVTEILPQLFGSIHIPAEVQGELTHSATPAMVKEWMLRAPDWLTIHPSPELGEDRSLEGLDAGERAAILLAIALKGDLLLMDERAGAATARAEGLAVTGTIGVLDLGSRAGLISLREVFPRLQRTNFRYAPSLLEELLEEEELRRIHSQ